MWDQGKLHEIKCWPEPFNAFLDGLKTFEWRKDDRNYQVGDRLDLKEWDPITQRYTGACITVWVNYKLAGPEFGIPEGYCILSINTHRRAATPRS